MEISQNENSFSSFPLCKYFTSIKKFNKLYAFSTNDL